MGNINSSHKLNKIDITPRNPNPTKSHTEKRLKFFTSASEDNEIFNTLSHQPPPSQSFNSREEFTPNQEFEMQVMREYIPSTSQQVS